MALYAFDGTLNFRDRKDSIERVQPSRYGDDRAHRRETNETNVHRFREFYGVDRTEYLEGVGTRFGWLGLAIGGAFGAGGKYRLRRMYRALCRRYFEEGDHDIDIVGFSRGAALAVQFSNILATHGVRNPAGKRHLLWWYYRGLGLTFRFPKPGADFVAEPRIRFLGLWDMVASFGIPVGPFRNWSLRWLGTLPAIVERAFHAMALDEVRATFALVRPKAKGERRKTDGTKIPKSVYELWFRGVHSNVGGGYVDRGLSDIALAWMMEMYIWTLNKLRIEAGAEDQPHKPADERALATFAETLRRTSPDPGPAPDWYDTSLETLEPDPNGELGRPPDVMRQGWRPLPLRPYIHHSVELRLRNLVSDHYRSNRRLLRTVPHNAQPVFDPPFFYSLTPRQAAEKLAEEIFSHIPVRPQDWLQVATGMVFRSDDWVAVGRDRKDLDWVVHKRVFCAITTEWLLAGRPEHATELELEPTHYPDYHGNEIETPVMAARVLGVLAATSQYVPELSAGP